MKTVRIYNIKWDIDENTGYADLPTEIVHDFPDEDDEDLLCEMISDWLSDEYGFCHDGFLVEIEDVLCKVDSV